MPDPAALARRYRRLLVAYPRAYRRVRGAEIVDTMLDAAEEGHPLPPVRAAVDLVGGGLRARLGRPRSRLVVPLSIVTAILVGLLASAIGYRLAWQARTGPLPTNAEAGRIAATAMDGDVLWTQRDDFVFGWSGHRHSVPAEIALWPFSTDAVPGVEDSDLYDVGSVWVESARRTTTPVAVAARTSGGGCERTAGRWTTGLGRTARGPGRCWSPAGAGTCCCWTSPATGFRHPGRARAVRRRPWRSRGTARTSASTCRSSGRRRASCGPVDSAPGCSRRYWPGSRSGGSPGAPNAAGAPTSPTAC
ncbi:hypothetical protein NUM_57370 [Actinocatenispora comari]|uniref:Uncharacterized protein n=1 Tax=Actinocatenispora comari TaxID=2807577 RepID=A0A8J4AKL3_9ACTN|nr:hypothetical protein NUM_57370 [Actinocatenispora comari]